MNETRESDTGDVYLNVTDLTDDEVWNLGREFYGRYAAKMLRTAMIKLARERGDHAKDNR